MKIKITLLFLLISLISLQAQWSLVSSQNTGLSGRLHIYEDVLFNYGVYGKFNFFRSLDNGETWDEIAAQFPYDVYNMFNHKNEIFAITTNLGDDAYLFYTSNDGGMNFTEKSRISSVTDNGAILSLTADGDNLYAISNRKSFYLSTDNGLNWEEKVITTTAGGNIVSFATSGSTLVSAILGSGAVVSVDNGANWEIINPTSPAVFITHVINFNNSIYGISSGSGVFKFNSASKSWENLSQGLPEQFSFIIAKTLLEFNGTLFYAGIGFLDGKIHFFSSNDNGLNWTSFTSDGITKANGAISKAALAVSSKYLYFYDYQLETTGDVAYLYRTDNLLTSVESDNNLPNGFSLSQNYPNPFNPSTTIKYSIPNDEKRETSNVKLIVYDILGKEVATLVNNQQKAGNYEVKFNASNLPSGIYFYQISAENFTKTMKLNLIK